MNLTIRALVVVLAFAGAAASAKTPTPSVTAGKKPVPMIRIPMCPPDDPDACGMGK